MSAKCNFICQAEREFFLDIFESLVRYPRYLYRINIRVSAAKIPGADEMDQGRELRRPTLALCSISPVFASLIR